MKAWLIGILGIFGVVYLLFTFWRESKNGNYTSSDGTRKCHKCNGTGRIKNSLLPGLLQDEICYHCRGTGVEED